MAALAIALTVVGGLAVAPALADPARTTAVERPDEMTMYRLISAYRASSGAPPVKIVPQLVAAAQWYATDMARNDSFSHTHIDTLGRGISERFLAFGYDANAPLGECSLQGFDSPEDAFNQFRLSPAHDAIMKDKRMHGIGVGVASSDAGTFWVASFGGSDVANPRAHVKKKPASKKKKTRRHATARR